MALSELTSNLSWYGTNAGFRAAQNVEETRFTYDQGDLTVSSAPRGFNNAGFQSNAFIPRISGNAFNINGQGTATRLSQLGEGSKFPIGPEGQIHDFDTKRTGFSINARYGDIFNNKVLKGLAATYTAASPIDDMYNKYKVREEVHDPYGYAKAPFILKGIQRDGSSDPERYGMSGVTLPSLNVPNGGIIVNATRTADDIVRIGKFLIRPDGLMFIAKQQILRQMLPNLEGTITLNPVIPGGSVAKVNSQSLYNPLNTIASILGLPIGARFRNFGVTPIDDGISRYEDVVVKNRVLDSMKVGYNRLGRLTEERERSVLSLLPYWNSISSLSGGPDSLGGLGPTIFSKSTRTLDKVDQFLNPQYDYTTPYLKTRSGLVATVDASNNDQENIDNRKSSTITINRAYTDRAYTELNLFNFLNSRPKNSLKQLVIKNREESVTIGYDFNLTGIRAQLAFHNGEIKGYGGYETTLLKNSYTNPYIGEDRSTNDDDIINADVTDQIDELSKINGLYSRVINDDEFTAIPQREVNKAANIENYRVLAYASIPTRNGKKSNLDINTTNGSVEYKFDKTPIALLAAEKKINTIVDSSKDKNVSDRWDRAYGDLIKFNIGGVAFFAYLTSLSMSDSFGTDEKKELLAPYGQFLYSDHSRSVDVSFMVVADSAAQLERQWSKLRQLQQQSGPVNISSGMIRPKTSSLTIGDIYNSLPVILESISFSIDNESPWEITDTYQRPMYISVDVSCRVLPSSKTSLPTVG
jgi:hypothetical protein